MSKDLFQCNVHKWYVRDLPLVPILPAGVMTVGVDCTPVHWAQAVSTQQRALAGMWERWNRNRPRYRSLASWVTLTFTPGHSEMKPSIIWGGHGVLIHYINPRSFSNKFCTSAISNICPNLKINSYMDLVSQTKCSVCKIVTNNRGCD